MKSYYLFFGIGEYENEWSSLDSPKNDLPLLAGTLERKYGFEPLGFPSSEEATKPLIIDWMDRLVEENILSECDQLLIYFSCHGHAYATNDQHYWIAHDGKLPSTRLHGKDGWVGSEDIIGAFKQIPCRHILLLSDACFSGKIIEKYKGSSLGKGMPAPGQPRDCDEVAICKRSREIITSCLNEPTPDTAGNSDFSSFAYGLAELLEKNPRHYWRASQMAEDLKDQVGGRCCPVYSTLMSGGHVPGGGFVFIQPDITAVQDAQSSDHSKERPEVSFDETDHYRSGIALMEGKKNKDAQRCFELALALAASDQEKYDAQIGLGRTYKELKNYEKALRCFESALDIKNDDYSALYHIASTKRLKEEMDEAETLLSKLIARDSDDPWVQFELAALYAETYREPWAIAICDSILKNRPDFNEASSVTQIKGLAFQKYKASGFSEEHSLLREMLLSQGRISSLAEVYIQYVLSRAQTAKDWRLLAYYFIHEDTNLKRASFCLEKAEACAEDVNCWVLIAKLWELLSETQNAKRCLSTARKLASSSKKKNIKLIGALVQHGVGGDFAEQLAEEFSKYAKKVHDHLMAARMWQGLFFKEEKEQASLQRAMELASTSSHWLDLAKFFDAFPRRDDAAQAILKAVNAARTGSDYLSLAEYLSGKAVENRCGILVEELIRRAVKITKKTPVLVGVMRLISRLPPDDHLYDLWKGIAASAVKHAQSCQDYCALLLDHDYFQLSEVERRKFLSKAKTKAQSSEDWCALARYVMRQNSEDAALCLRRAEKLAPVESVIWDEIAYLWTLLGETGERDRLVEEHDAEYVDACGFQAGSFHLY